MVRLSSFVGLLVCLACGGAGSLPVALTASPSSSPPDAMACVKAKLDTLGYSLVSFDQADLRLNMRRVDNSINRADPQYRRNIDRLEIQATPAADGKTSLTITGRSYAEYETHRGPTEQEERASANVRQTAQALVDACGRS
ncbi:MAG TPA: hypothetical protein VJQ46_00120 [Gemmatimonadales bacterium]|nr:hypothetical protein [Gemmatimonadales bacterium]